MDTLVYKNQVERRDGGAAFISSMKNQDGTTIRPIFHNISSLMLREWPSHLQIRDGSIFVPVRLNPVAPRIWCWVGYYTSGVCGFTSEGILHKLHASDQDDDTLSVVRREMRIVWK